MDNIYEVVVEADPSDHAYFELSPEEVALIKRLGKHLGILIWNNEQPVDDYAIKWAESRRILDLKEK